jgi:hypothetical protein
LEAALAEAWDQDDRGEGIPAEQVIVSAVRRRVRTLSVDGCLQELAELFGPDLGVLQDLREELGSPS